MSVCKQLEEDFFVSGQVTRESLEQAAALGITRLINNRPDGEEAGQPSSKEVGAWAGELGLDYHFIPVAAGAMTPEVLAQFSAAVNCASVNSAADGVADDIGVRVLASCRTGTRSCVLWALDRASCRAAPVDHIIAAAGEAGYDISAMKASLEQLAGSSGQGLSG